MNTPSLSTLLRSDWGDIIFQRALRAYVRRVGASADQPSATSSEFEGPSVFILSNASGELARYGVTFTGVGGDVEARLRFTDRARAPGRR